MIATAGTNVFGRGEGPPPGGNKSRFWSHQREFARPAARRDLLSSHQAIKPGFRRALLPPARTTFDVAPTDEDKIRFCPRPWESAPAVAAADGHPPRQFGATRMASNPSE